jgi:hypothetical protein
MKKKKLKKKIIKLEELVSQLQEKNKLYLEDIREIVLDEYCEHEKIISAKTKWTLALENEDFIDKCLWRGNFL